MVLALSLGLVSDIFIVVIVIVVVVVAVIFVVEGCCGDIWGWTSGPRDGGWGKRKTAKGTFQSIHIRESNSGQYSLYTLMNYC